MLWTLLKELHKVQAIETTYGQEGSKWDSSCKSEEDNNNGGLACVGLTFLDLHFQARKC
jgi:hypothetical protein